MTSAAKPPTRKRPSYSTTEVSATASREPPAACASTPATSRSIVRALPTSGSNSCPHSGFLNNLLECRLMNGKFPLITDEDRLGKTGMAIVERIVERQIGWIFRSQDQPRDYGIDGHIEVVKDGSRVTGRLVAAQVKCGSSWFDESTDEGYVFRPKDKHVAYWTNYSLPVIIILCMPNPEDAWWVEVSDATVSSTGKGWKIVVPFDQKFDRLSATPLSMIAGRRLETRILERYQTRIRRAPIVSDAQFFECIARGGLLIGFRRIGEYDYRGLVLTQDYMTIQSDAAYDLDLWRDTLELAGVEDWEIEESIEKAEVEIF